MPVEIETKNIKQKVLHVKVKEKLTEADYDSFLPKIEELLDAGKLRILLELKNFEGWTASAAWEDTKFGIKHFNDIERLAIVGEKQLEKGMASFCKMFTTAEVKFFEAKELEKAEEWIGLKNKGGEE